MSTPRPRDHSRPAVPASRARGTKRGLEDSRDAKAARTNGVAKGPQRNYDRVGITTDALDEGIFCDYHMHNGLPTAPSEGELLTVPIDVKEMPTPRALWLESRRAAEEAEASPPTHKKTPAKAWATPKRAKSPAPKARAKSPAPKATPKAKPKAKEKAKPKAKAKPKPNAKAKAKVARADGEISVATATITEGEAEIRTNKANLHELTTSCDEELTAGNDQLEILRSDLAVAIHGSQEVAELGGSERSPSEAEEVEEVLDTDDVETDEKPEAQADRGPQDLQEVDEELSEEPGANEKDPEPEKSGQVAEEGKRKPKQEPGEGRVEEEIEEQVEEEGWELTLWLDERQKGENQNIRALVEEVAMLKAEIERLQAELRRQRGQGRAPPRERTPMVNSLTPRTRAGISHRKKR